MLNYRKQKTKETVQTARIYETESDYKDKNLYRHFLQLKINVIDINPALVTKAIAGTEQDFIMLMQRADGYIAANFPDLKETERERLLEMFRECVFGYYVLVPLLQAKDVSDIKVYSYDHIVVKANGERYVTDCRFFDEQDYLRWYERILKINRIRSGEENSLGHFTDRRGVSDYYIRIDTQLSYITSTEQPNIHLRKMPKKKLSWEYLIEQKMLTGEMLEYITDRIESGYGFLISGRGGSGKSTLLNNMLDMIPFDQSGLVIQESDELYSHEHPQLQFEHTMRVNRGGYACEFTLEDELQLGLLQDIDNFIIGEIKGGEALYVFTTALSTGARFFGTIHANDAAGSVKRLAHCARYISSYSMETLEEMLAAVPFVLIHMNHFSIDEILEIGGWDAENSRLNYETVYEKG